ncbi:hypothetical protein K469DRAFT_609444, partial [Zopfia rhizophila CBS 207.26]
VKKILVKFKKVNLYINIIKYKFKVILTKYIKFIIKVSKGIYINLNKVKIIKK